MGTLGGFPNPPALWLRRAKPDSAYAINGNPLPDAHRPLAALGLAKPSAPARRPPLRSLRSVPALWLRQAKPDSAYAINGNPLPPAHRSARALAPARSAARVLATV